jgi:hypothetical protein
MKYANIWKQQVQELPIKLQSSVLSYKNWKKLSKLNYNEDYLKILEKDCQNINNIIKKKYKIYNIKNIKNIICWNNNMEKITNKDLYSYMILNQTTLHKICKRMDKRNNFHLFIPWLNKNYKQFYFNYGLYYTRILLENNILKNITCPICLCELELTEKNPILITDCGHIFCIECIRGYYKTYEHHGTLKNIINYHEHYIKHESCPECRSYCIFYDLNELNIWPKESKHILYKDLYDYMIHIKKSWPNV